MGSGNAQWTGISVFPLRCGGRPHPTASSQITEPEPNQAGETTLNVQTKYYFEKHLSSNHISKWRFCLILGLAGAGIPAQIRVAEEFHQ